MKIGICTAFSGMMDFYSLTSVVRSQLRMVKSAGHHPVLIGLEDFRWENPPDYVELRPIIPAFKKIDYKSLSELTEEHQRYIPRCVEALQSNFQDLDAILAHDMIFLGWNMPMGIAIQQIAANTPPWLHWIHSVPGGGKRDFWRIPPNSRLIYPNHTDRVRCAEHFSTWQENVVIIPHCVDMRDIFFTTQLAEKLVTDYDVLGADFVQVYPIPTDRGDAKGIPQVIKMFGHLKRAGHSVRLVVPNAWCNVPQWRDRVDGYYKQADEHGLTDREVIFISKAYPEHELGVPMEVVKDLALCGNIFICPTKSETFGLSIAEAALAGSLLVLNDDLPPMPELCGGRANAIWAKFSSNFFTTKHGDEDAYYRDICKIIAHVTNASPSFRSKSFYRKMYRREAVWQLIENTIVSMKGPRCEFLPVASGMQFSQSA
jgi:hypothetical protein